MSRRKTVRVAQLEGRADAFRDARERMEWALPCPSEVRAKLRDVLWEMETEALRDMTKAQRAQEEA